MSGNNKPTKKSSQRRSFNSVEGSDIGFQFYICPAGKELFSIDEVWAVTGKALLTRWNINFSMLKQFIVDLDLPVRDAKSMSIFDPNLASSKMALFHSFLETADLDRFLFRQVDIEGFEDRHQNFIKTLASEYTIMKASPRGGRLCIEQETLSVNDLPQGKAEHEDPESFIRSMQVSYVDNTEVKFQYKGKHKDFNCAALGFRDSGTKEWQTFLEILQSKDHVYKLGPAKYNNKQTGQLVRITEYDKKNKRLQIIGVKLRAFLSKQYDIKFPSEFKLYEPQPSQGPGAYSFKFQIPANKPSYKTKVQALERLKMLIQSCAQNNAINDAVLMAMDAGASKAEVHEIVKDWEPSSSEYREASDESDNDDQVRDDD